MEIETERLKLVELGLLYVSKVENIARDMAWNDTINLLLRNDLDDSAFIRHDKKDLLKYREIIVTKAEKIIQKPFIEFNDSDTKDLYQKISQDSIPQEYWHINFPQLSFPFREKSLEYIIGAIKRKKEENRLGFWLGIKDKESNQLIGVLALSLKATPDKEGKNKIGHFGRFIHPKHQRKGYVSEVGAVALDFMYKYLIDENVVSIPENTVFYTTCDQLNVASQKLQEKSGAVQQNICLLPTDRMMFYAIREQHEQSKLMLRPIKWKAKLDNGEMLISTVGKNNKLRHIKTSTNKGLEGNEP